MRNPSRLPITVLFALALPLAGQGPALPPDGDELSAVLRKLGEEVRVFDQHVVTLANPVMEGRVPGSRGMELAMEYMEFWFRQHGVEPAFPKAGGKTPWRQPFPLGGTYTVRSQSLSVGDVAFAAGSDIVGSKLGGSGEIEAPVAFVGYGIQRGPDDFSSFPEDFDLEGKIAVAFRFEPMDANGKSRFADDGALWSRYADLQSKVTAVRRKKAAALILVNPPDCADPRARELVAAAGSGRGAPVLHMTTEAAGRMLAALDPERRSLADLRKLADAGRQCLTFPTKAKLAVEVHREELVAENVGALLRGKGALADQYVVIGAHLDHLGMGEFGSRSGPGKLHPGADDNATGSAALLMLADRLNRTYAALPDGASARSILFLAFSAEESGLNGSRYYVENPLVPLAQHTLMINFDMIGRVRDKRLSVSGLYSAKGLAELLEPVLADTPLEIVKPKGIMAASDHAAFYAKKVPVLFAIIADFHGDYHTPEDLPYKLNRVDAVHTVDLFEKIALAVGTHPSPLEFAR